MLAQDQQHYHQAIKAISLAIHPFHLTTQAWQFTPISEQLTVPLAQLRQLEQTYGGAKASQAIDFSHHKLPSLLSSLTR